LGSLRLHLRYLRERSQRVTRLADAQPGLSVAPRLKCANGVWRSAGFSDKAPTAGIRSWGHYGSTDRRKINPPSRVCPTTADAGTLLLLAVKSLCSCCWVHRTTSFHKLGKSKALLWPLCTSLAAPGWLSFPSITAVQNSLKGAEYSLLCCSAAEQNGL
jgi:hypothetical protein